METVVEADDFMEVKEELDLDVVMETDSVEKINQVEQDAFTVKVERFYREKNLEFKIPKFYGADVDLLKLWRQVMNLGGYDEVCAKKLWKQVGKTFDPPKTCTSLSFTFRQFYAKALLEYERSYLHAFGITNFGDLAMSPHQTAATEMKGTKGFREDSVARTETGRIPSGPNRSENETRTIGSDYEEDRHAFENFDPEAKQGCTAGSHDHSHKLLLRDFKLSWRNMKRKCDLSRLSLETTKSKRPSTTKRRSDFRTQLKPSTFVDNLHVEYDGNNIGLSFAEKIKTVVADEGGPAEWVKINAYKAKDAFEIYALVPGLTPKELRVECEVSGRVVITGSPGQGSNLWGLTNFRKVINLPSKIDTNKFEASVSIYGQLLLRVPILLGMPLLRETESPKHALFKRG